MKCPYKSEARGQRGEGKVTIEAEIGVIIATSRGMPLERDKEPVLSWSLQKELAFATTLFLAPSRRKLMKTA